MNIALLTELRNALRRRGALPFVRVRLSFPVFKVLVLSGKRLAFCRLCLIGSRGRPINLLVQRRWNLGELGHWTINLVNAILENIANQKVDDAHAVFGILAQETREAESLVIESVNKLAHRFDASIEL